MDEIAAMLVNQIVAIAWLRCVIEEGVDFVNKQTGAVERNEQVVYASLEAHEGIFDVPAAKGSKLGLEKNILEVLGSYTLNIEDDELLSVLTSSSLRAQIKDKIEEIRNR